MLRRCSVKDCEEPAERCLGSCLICSNHFCATHASSQLHVCSSANNDSDAYFAAIGAGKQQHLEALLAKIQPGALETAASNARNGISCRIPALDASVDLKSRIKIIAQQCGGQNCHVDVEFSDGITWLARLRLEDPLLPPAAVQAKIFLSEVATLEYLAQTMVPVPQIFGYGLESVENTVGTSYVLMEKLKGKPLDWYSANPEQRAKVMEQLADIYVELEKHPMPLTGSLYTHIKQSHSREMPSMANSTFGPFAQPPCFETPEKALGPFAELDEAYPALIRQQMHTFLNHELSSLPLDNYLTLIWRLENLSNLIEGSVSRKGPFYLRHFDDKGDHILIDEHFNITGIIDWEFASFEAKEQAFNSPCMMWPVGDFFDGGNHLSEDELQFAAMFEQRGRADLAKMIRGSRQWQRYLYFLGGGFPTDIDELKSLFEGLRKSFSVNMMEDLKPYEKWRQDMLDRFKRSDLGIQALLRDQRAAMRNAEP